MGELRSCGIPCTVILDSAVGYVMGEVHCVMLGAEGVAESGGIINKVGIFYYLKYSNQNNIQGHISVYFYFYFRLELIQ